MRVEPAGVLHGQSERERATPTPHPAPERFPFGSLIPPPIPLFPFFCVGKRRGDRPCERRTNQSDKYQGELTGASQAVARVR